MPFQSHEVNRRRLVFSKHYKKFSRQKLCCEDEVPYENDVTGVIGHAHYIWGQIFPKNPLAIFGTL